MQARPVVGAQSKNHVRLMFTYTKYMYNMIYIYVCVCVYASRLIVKVFIYLNR